MEITAEKAGNKKTKREQLFANRIETIISEEGKKFLSPHEKFEVDVKPKDKIATKKVNTKKFHINT